MTVGELRQALASYPDSVMVMVEGCDCTSLSEEVGWCLAWDEDDEAQRRVLIRSGGISYLKKDEQGNWRDGVGLVSFTGSEPK